jgi:polysaccharide biosynthesis transport protein
MEPIPNFEEIDFQKHLQVLQRRWIPAVGVFGIVVTAVSLVAFSLKPSYKAEGSLLIRNRSSSLVGLGDGMGKLEALAIPSNPLQTQAKIVTSEPLIQETISTLNLRDNKGKPLKLQEFAKRLKVETVKETDILLVGYKDNNPQIAAAVVNKVIDIYIRNNIQANRAEAVSARKFILDQLPRTEMTVRQSESALRQFKERNQVVVLEQEANAAVTTISTLEEDITKAQAQLADTNAQLQKLHQQAKVDTEQAVTLGELSQVGGIQDVLKQLQEAQNQLTVQRTRYLPGHPAILNLEDKVIALQSLLQQRRQEVTGSQQNLVNNSQQNSLSNSQSNLQLGKLRQDLVAELLKAEKEYIGLKERIKKLTDARTSYKQRAQLLPKLEQTQRELERKLKASQNTYETLLTRLQEINVAENQNVGNARIVSSALVPENPDGPQKPMILGGGILVGLLLGSITAFSLDLIDRSVKTVKEARDLFQYTLLGLIPSWQVSSRKISISGTTATESSVPKIIMQDIPPFPLGDAYQMLQANLKFIRTDKRLKTITVTSSVCKEGKSEVSANLAVIMAQMGTRVLLVDADMRHPTQHHIWEMTNAIGLSNVIVDQVSFNAAIHEVMPNLYVLSAGVVPPNPVSLLDSQRMATLINNFAEEYDYVIFDTPPLVGIADAAVLGKLTDGILLVVRPEVVDSGSAKAAKEFLIQSDQDVLGMVINAVNIKHEPNNYSYYMRKQTEKDYTSRQRTINYE